MKTLDNDVSHLWNLVWSKHNLYTCTKPILFKHKISLIHGDKKKKKPHTHTNKKTQRAQMQSQQNKKTWTLDQLVKAIFYASLPISYKNI